MPFAHPCLPLRVGVDVRAVVIEEVTLNIHLARLTKKSKFIGPKIRRVAKPEELDCFGRNAAPGDIVTSDLSAGLISERALPALGDLLVNLEQSLLEMP